MSVGTYTDWLSALGRNESGNNYGFVSSLGYLGRFQFGEEALQAVGFYQGDGTAAIDFAGSWSSVAAAYGVSDKASFLASSAAQDAAGGAWFAKVYSDLTALGLDKYLGQTVGGVQITASGLVAGGHLAGVWNLKSFLESGGANDWRDGYGTPVSEYVSRFGGFDTPFGAQASTPAATQATAGDDIITVDQANSTVHAAAGADTLDAAGYTGSTYLRGDDGNDAITGGSGFDDINGNAGADTEHGNAGDDWVVGGKDDDRLYGDAGGDVVWGNMGADTLDGGDGNDQVRGGQGDDVLSGGAGNDYISGDRGADSETGGAGADTFHTWGDAGLDKVFDFNAAEGDRVMLDAGTVYTVGQEGADTVIHMQGGGEMILVGVSLSTLPTGWLFYDG